MMSLGVLTIVCVVIFIIWILLELLRLILNIGVKYIYHHASSKIKQKYLYGLMEMYLKSYGIDYQLGLDSIEVDETLEKMDLIHKVIFLRVVGCLKRVFMVK